MSDPLSSGGSPSHPSELTDSFVISDSQEPEQLTATLKHKEFKARFVSHSVETHKAEMKLMLKPYKDITPGSQQALGKKLIRKLGKVRALFKPSLPAEQQPVPGWEEAHIPAPEWQDELGVNQVDMFVSDERLLKNIDSGSEFYVRMGNGALFNGEVPETFDIAQLDRRQTCFLLSALGAYAMTPLGNRLLQQIIRLYPEGFVGVTLNDDALAERNVKILVSSSRPVDGNGKDFYSFANSSGARWPGYIEKACHALLLERSDNIKQMKQDMPDEDLSHIEGLLRLLTSDEKTDCLLDRIDMSLAFSLLPPMPELESTSPAFQQPQKPSIFDVRDDALEDPMTQEQIRFNIQNGIPVIMGTRGDWKGALNATSGTPTNHAVTVLGPAFLRKGSTVVEGFLTYDPYGEAFGSSDIATASAGAVTNVKAVGQAIRFCSYGDIHNYFNRVAIARGGFVHNPEYLKQLAAKKPDGTGDEDGWELL
ncbi:hypothetical protein [Endozoicomonas euniceicola]|uniref:Uncharacterized protein n=1 Tax=Endozoicomonas euniceicola TaxID=1234143 RepID=A0ABY6GUS4_9GAMM|nr:hypothetical protein [Endozoicomonas euniceicola]UYM16522.1 hypothetical protein NX720_00885 [Endozoicomonas euniceicola]